MTDSVNTNINALAAVQALSVIGNQLSQTQNAIETGLKVGSASDNPAVFTIAQGLRANTGALSAVSDTIATGLATLQGATSGATSIDNALSSLLQVVTQSEGQQGSALSASLSAVSNLLANIDTFAAETTINGVNLVSGSYSATGSATGSTAPSTSLTVITNLTGSGLTVSQQSISTKDLSLTTTSGTATGSLLSAVSAGTTLGTQSAINLVQSAINTVGTALATLGAYQGELTGLEDFTNQLNTSTTTTIGAISDANLAEESAKLSSLQTKQQLATQSLSIANQAPSSLLSLFR
jgi:flagellin